MPKKATQPQTSTAKSDKANAEPVKDDTLDTVIKDFKAAWDYTKESHHDRWDNDYKLYHGKRVKRGYRGITDTFVPMAFSTVETLTSGLFGSKPKWNFLPPRNNPDQNTDILNALLDYYWELDQWSVKVINTGRNGLMLGNGEDYWCWVNDHPVMINVPIRDFFIDPTATTHENARFMGRRYLTTIDELESYEVIDLDNPVEQTNLETGETETTYGMKKKYKSLDKLKNASGEPTANTGNDEKTDKQEKDDLYGSTLKDQDGQVEVIEYWTDDKVISVANRSVVIEDCENYFKAKARANGEENPRGLMPFAGFRDYTDASLFYAKGEIDFIADEQELLNDITNQNIDAITYVLNPMYTLDPKYGDMIDQVENLPGAVYPFEPGTLARIEMGGLPNDAFNERMNIKNEIRETTASNEVVKGVGQIEGGKATATEINAQIAGAGQRINLKVTQIENEYFHRMAKIVLRLIKLYVTEPMMVRIVGRDGVRWEEFNPAEFANGEYEPRVQLDISVENKKQEQAMQAKEMMAAFLNDPDVNQQELKKLVLSRSFDLEPDEVEKLMTPPEMPMGGMVGPDGMPLDPMGMDMAGAVVPTPADPAMPVPMDYAGIPELAASLAPPQPQEARPTLGNLEGIV